MIDCLARSQTLPVTRGQVTNRQEWIRAETSAHFFEADGENFSTTSGAALPNMGFLGDHALFDDLPCKAVLPIEFECARLHQHGARFLTWAVGFRNETALHVPADQS